MCSKTLLLLCTIAVRTAALAPSFDTFSAAATGSWTGTLYEWPGDANGVACESVVDEVMRSCGGAVQGVRVDDGPLLNRQDDGFCFFDCGSWTQGPTKLTDGALSLDVASPRRRARAVHSTARATWSTQPSSWRSAPTQCGRRARTRSRVVDAKPSSGGARRGDSPGGVSIAQRPRTARSDVADDVGLARGHRRRVRRPARGRRWAAPSRARARDYGIGCSLHWVTLSSTLPRGCRGSPRP